MTKDEALKLALEALEESKTNNDTMEFHDRKNKAITATKQALAAPVQEPVEVDQATMELAESVGLIGPASRTHDLHAAIQRFHDLICVNATIKAAKMAADAISESTPPATQRQWVGLTDYEIGVCSTEAAMNRSEMVGGAVNFARAIEAKLKEKNT